MSHITNLTDRQVIWVIGAKCGEGKSWFQDYVESLYGFNRVVAGMNIKVNTASLCHALQKRPLATTDIFMFNIGKSKTKYAKDIHRMITELLCCILVTDVAKYSVGRLRPHFLTLCNPDYNNVLF